MRKFVYVLLISLVLSCSYDSNDNESKKEVKPLALSTFNVQTKMVRVNSTIAWQWKDSAGFIHNLDAGEYAIDNSKGNGKFTCTNSESVLIEPLGDYYEKKNSESSVMEIDKSKGAVFNTVLIQVASGTPHYIEILKPVIGVLESYTSSQVILSIYNTNGSRANFIIVHGNTTAVPCILPIGKYLLLNNGASGGLSLFTIDKSVAVSNCYTDTTVNPGW